MSTTTAIAAFKAQNVKEDCFAFVKPITLDGETLSVTIVGRRSEEELARITFSNAKEFMDSIPKLFTNQFKAVILNIFQHETSVFSDNLQFCKAVKAALNVLQVPSYFITDVDYASMQLLISLNATVKVNDTIFIVIVTPSNLTLTLLEFTSAGFKVLEKKNVFIDREKETAPMIRQKILGSSNPKKILLCLHAVSTSTEKKFYRDVLKSKKLVVFDRYQPYDICKFIVERSKWMLDKSYIKFAFVPICALTYQVINRFGASASSMLVIKTDGILPYKETAHCSRIFVNNVYFGNGYKRDNGSFPINYSKIQLKKQKCHGYNITLSVDNESFPTIKHEPIISPDVITLPKTLDTKAATKIPVIAFYDNLSFICVYKNGGYHFLDGWNGEFGKELAIGFDKEKPSFCENVLPLFAKKPSCIVYNILQIMAMSSKPQLVDYIQTYTTWPFKIIKDEENPILLEFDNFDGTKKAASPAFLMAMLLKEHLKAIKEESGEKPKQIGFYLLLLKNLGEDDIEQIKAQLQESCELLKIECEFI